MIKSAMHSKRCLGKEKTSTKMGSKGYQKSGLKVSEALKGKG